MRTNIVLDEKLVKEAKKLTDIKTKKELVNEALLSLIRDAKRKKLLLLKGKVKWDGNLDEMRKN